MYDMIERWFTQSKGNWIDLLIADRVFGGRLGESPQIPTAYQVIGSVIQIQFQTTERLVVTHPTNVRIGPHSELVIGDASDARFGWHYYGRPQVPENWCEEIYQKFEDRILLTRIGAFRPATDEYVYSGNEFIKLL